ncbi:aminotransferase class IV [Peptoniphilus sp. HMSC075B08]|uniref:aminotransferase class IV n=1 Tax=Peptoniphilus sp. HMSC075B08 TaxID=1739525 RepID=UPI0008A408FF|nr:aminotransferase class IV [Peptoniphilus sp. HMSC075B08]OFO60070.1 aminotransferase class IV [Peptoniphilus sp. HMSC075B08]
MKIEFDDGYSFGKGAFETIKVVDGRPLFLERHLERLKKSLEFFGISKEIEEEKILEYIKSSEDKNFALKLIVSDKNFILTSREDNYRKDNKRFKLIVSEVRRNSSSKMIYHKSLSYYENIMEHRLALDKGYDSALFINERGEVCETSFANIFFVRDGEIFTPVISSGLLKGTMRDFIIENYKVREEIIYLDDLKNFDEAFISNSLMGVRNVSLINDIIFNEEDKTNLIQVDLKKYGF